MRQCNHSDVRLFSDAPVVDVDTGCEGQTVRILCRRNLSDVILGFELREASAYMCGLRDAGVPVFEMMDAYLKDYMAALKASPVVNQN